MDESPDEDNFPGRLLHQAALWDNVELVSELLLEVGVDQRDHLGRTALLAAALNEHSLCLSVLLDKGADVAARDADTEKTALHISAERGFTDNVIALLNAGSAPLQVDANGDTALTLAERAGHRHTAKVLRDATERQERARLSEHATLRELVLSGESAVLKSKVTSLGRDAGILVNMTPGGANTLLYIASESGRLDIAKILISAGADGRAHPVTKYSPLYGASYRGHGEMATLLLQHYPEAVQQETVERWLPIHAACIGGHPSIVTLLLQYQYPEHLLNTYTDPTGQFTYRAAFDINSRDVSGHTPLHVASTLGNVGVVTALLEHSVVPEQTPAQKDPVLSPLRSGISLGIHAIVNKLTGQSSQERSSRIRPISVREEDALCVAVLGAHVGVVEKLLAAGADPDRPVSLKLVSGEMERRTSTSTSPTSTHSCSEEAVCSPLLLAVRNKNTHLADLLLSAGATDEQGAALRECNRLQLQSLYEAILVTRSYPDPEFKLNMTAAAERAFRREGDSALTFRALCPRTPAMVNWKDLHCLTAIKVQWLSQCCVRVNPRVSCSRAALRALTRLDLAGNLLTTLPPEIFSMLSLRYLNVAQNKLERLPTAADLPEEPPSLLRRARSLKPEVYTAPVLEEIYLQDNRLEEVPPGMFTLPSLATLDLSNNKLQALPAQMWTAPVLTDLNVALNHLRELPTTAMGESERGRSAVSEVASTDKQLSSLDSDSSQLSEDVPDEDEEGLPYLGDRSGTAVCTPARRVLVPHETEPAWSPVLRAACVPLATLNLSHNQFTCVPHSLACLAPKLTRLNMAYNKLRSMSYVTSYPTGLRQLDLGHNEITCWPSLPQVERLCPSEGDPLPCFCPPGRGRPPARSSSRPRPRPRSASSARAQLLNAACPARRHLRLDSLRTLILCNNLLTRIQLSTDDDGDEQPEQYDQHSDGEDPESTERARTRGRLLFPQLSMLDVSYNLLRSVPRGIHALTALSVFNISGNKDITELPPQMGLLSRLWNLSAADCELREPLRSMTRGRYRSSELVGYLRGVLQRAGRYRRVKLMLVGEANVGKTSLLHCLRGEGRRGTEHWSRRMGNKSARRGENVSTVGVDIGSWSYEGAHARGAVTFRTWDFGGQHEYYATHQYFLSGRALYVVVWRSHDGRRGLRAATSWLRSVQSRAPGALVVMVATHADLPPAEDVPEDETPESLQRLIRTHIIGLPDADKRGLPRVIDSIEVSCSTRANIRVLADVLYNAAFTIKPPGSKEPLLSQLVPASYLSLEECVHQLSAELPEPVLRREEFRRHVATYFSKRGWRGLPDDELHRAVVFLHENGVLLHYEDAALKELYFLSPQWLCDLLAHVVTVREVNPFAVGGLMKLEDLPHVLKASPALGDIRDASSLAVSLLNKFELALTWDSRLLLIPPLLPDVPPEIPQLPLRRRCHQVPSALPVVFSARESGTSLRRLLLLSYTPSGFWARLCTRIMGDEALAECAATVYTLPLDMEVDELTARSLELKWSWKLWKTGMKLVSGPLELLSLREASSGSDHLLSCGESEVEEYSNTRFKLYQEGAWSELDAASTVCIEVLLPALVCVARRDGADQGTLAGYQSVSLEAGRAALARVLSALCEHVDLLLEDWYPALGTRFVHTSEGRCLITRVCPCAACLREVHVQPARGRHDRVSLDSRLSDGDSGVGAESTPSSRLGSVEGALTHVLPVVHAWSVEECVLASSGGVTCPTHGHLDLRDLAPDTVLLDVEESRRARWESIKVGGEVGRGSFGQVVRAVWRGGGCAVKMMQPPATGQHKCSRQPAALAGRAYCALRQELSVLATLHHPHVAALVAVCAAPLALLLELAPLGSLDSVLREYRGCGARVEARVLRVSCLHVGRALEYLHARRVLYRDLKSENVLVWKFPRARDAPSVETLPAPVPVLLKLGDYGISRLAAPSGSKGFGGTEGFMAPEIAQYNGEQEYDEKVDCFSFGMLMYEIISLRPPFEGQDAVRDAVLEGARPALSPRELRYPRAPLELMRACWAGRARRRPSAACIVADCAAPEFAALQDVVSVSVQHDAPAVAVAVAGVDDDGERGHEIWMGGEDGRLRTLTCTARGFCDEHDVSCGSSRVTALCAGTGTVWVGDEEGWVRGVRVGGARVEWGVRLSDVVGGEPASVTSILHLTDQGRLLLATARGRLFLARDSCPSTDGVFVLSELGAATQLSCAAAVHTAAGDTQVWAGGDGLYMYTVRAGGVVDATTVREGGGAPVSLMCGGPAGGGGVLTCCTHESVVVLWMDGREMTRLDVSKLAPSSESLHSIEKTSDRNSQVSSLCCRGRTVLVGRTDGAVVTLSVPPPAAPATPHHLLPLAVCRPHVATLGRLVPLPRTPHVVSLGSGYRPLLPRYLSLSHPAETDVSERDGTHAVLWRDDCWLPD